MHEYADIEGDTVKEQEERMMAEIYQRGPIACGISVTDELYKHYKGGVFFDKTNATQIDHDISVVGYGVDKPTGLKYWLIRNSWGTYWVRYFVPFRSMISQVVFLFHLFISINNKIHCSKSISGRKWNA